MLWLVSGLFALTFAIHTFVGGPRVAGPLLSDARLPPASKWLNYYCWHIVTVLLAFVSIGFAALALGHRPDPVRMALAFSGVLALALSALSVAVALRGDLNPMRFPSTSLFAAIAIACCAGLAV